MASSNEKLEKLCKLVYKDEMMKQLIDFQRRIITNTDTGSIDCTYKNIGDIGYEAYNKMIIFTNNVFYNTEQVFNKFCEYYSKVSFVSNGDLLDLLIQIDSDTSGTNVKVTDLFFNNSSLFYNFLNISVKDINT